MLEKSLITHHNLQSTNTPPSLFHRHILVGSARCDSSNYKKAQRKKSRQQTLHMPNRLKTMKVQNASDPTKELGNEEDTCPILPGGGEVSLQDIISLSKRSAPPAPKVQPQHSRDGGIGCDLQKVPAVCSLSAWEMPDKVCSTSA